MIQRLIRSLLIHVIYFPEYVHVLDGFILRCMTCVTVGFDSSTFGVKSSKTVTDGPDPPQRGCAPWIHSFHAARV